MKFISKEAQNFDHISLPPFWTVLDTLSGQAAFFWRDSIQEILLKWLQTSLLTSTLGYGCAWVMLFWAKHALSSEMIARKIVKWIIARKKTDSCRLFCFPSVSSRAKWRHMNRAWLPRQFQNNGLPSHFFRDKFLKESRHFRGWNFGE